MDFCCTTSTKRVSSRNKKHPLISPFVISMIIYYQEELEINDTTDAPKWANFIDLRLEFDEDGKHYIRLYDKRDEFEFHIVNLPYLNINIPESCAYAVLVSQLKGHYTGNVIFQNIKSQVLKLLISKKYYSSINIHVMICYIDIQAHL